jgi:hypothetical protein
MTETRETALPFLSESGAVEEGRAFVAIVKSPEELRRWLTCPPPQLQWLQVEGLLCDPEPWAEAAQGAGEIPLDVVVTNPEAEFSQIYRLADVRAAREVRVTIPAAQGLLKAVRLAASLGLPIRVLPGQPPAEVLGFLEAVADFYLHDPMVEAPIEPFHSLFSALRGSETETLWMILEEDPGIFAHLESDGRPTLPRSTQPAPPMFVRSYLSRLVEEGTECTACPWQQNCAGYFKWPDPDYSCEGVKRLFGRIKAAADEIASDLAASGETTP